MEQNEIYETIRKNQGANDLSKKVKLKDMPRLSLYKRVEAPTTVYHMTKKEYLDSILEDEQIKTFNDFACYFCLSLEDIKTYIETANLEEGGNTHDTAGKVIKLPPLKKEEMVILKIYPRYKDSGKWFIEDNIKNTKQELSEKAKDIVRRFDACRVAHFGNLKFFADEVEVINLTDIY